MESPINNVSTLHPSVYLNDLNIKYLTVKPRHDTTFDGIILQQDSIYKLELSETHGYSGQSHSGEQPNHSRRCELQINGNTYDKAFNTDGLLFSATFNIISAENQNGGGAKTPKNQKKTSQKQEIKKTSQTKINMNTYINNIF